MLALSTVVGFFLLDIYAVQSEKFWDTLVKGSVNLRLFPRKIWKIPENKTPQGATFQRIRFGGEPITY